MTPNPVHSRRLVPCTRPRAKARKQQSPHKAGFEEQRTACRPSWLLSKRDRVAEGRHKSHERGRKEGSVKIDSAAQQKPWEALGISRATYYRKKDAGTL